jgi:pimeloyl-ACP methyl ester carboxylesterase
MTRRTAWQRIRRVWVTLGVGFTVVFATWSLFAYQASREGRDAAASGPDVAVAHANGVWMFTPVGRTPHVRGLLFFPGALVDARAYAPIARAAAAAGHVAAIVELPNRGAFGGAERPVVFERARRVMSEQGAPDEWIIAGHSKGAVLTSSLAVQGEEEMAGVVLIGSTHPRDVDLSALRVPVTKIVGTRDGVAPMHKVDANRHLLPSTTRWIRVDGGNHSQFGWYGFQPGDRFAGISRAEQQRLTIDAVLCALSDC